MKTVSVRVTYLAKMFLEKCILLIFILKIVQGQLRIDPLVSTDVGLIKGLRANDGDYSMFLGIPFAQVDEDNPFGAATPYPKFDETFEAYEDSKICPQIQDVTNIAIGTLDCLNLNIYVPFTATSTNRLPVAVWLHGGSFKVGDGNRLVYGPKFLVKHDIILVTINYRLGPYGFMCLDIPEIPGNQGLKDQLLALRWVKKNIEAFGGDSNKITVFGESAGAISVDLHLLSNNEKLYDKAILQSGTAFKQFIPPNKVAPLSLSKKLGYTTDNINDALKFLGKSNSNLVIAAAYELKITDDFRPCVERKFEGVESIVNDNWIKSLLPKVKRMPILIGFNDDESHVFFKSEDDEYYKNLNIIRKQLTPSFDVDNNDFKEMEDVVRHFYFGDEEINASVKQNVIDFVSDFNYIHPAYRTIYKYLENDAGNIFFYVFSHVGERNYFRRTLNVTDGKGAGHADELGYLFDVEYMKNEPVIPEDQQIIDQITTMWANFIKYGDPTPQTSELLPVKWQPVTSKKELVYLNISSGLTLGSRPFSERAAFWDLFYMTSAHLQIDNTDFNL